MMKGDCDTRKGKSGDLYSDKKDELVKRREVERTMRSMMKGIDDLVTTPVNG